MNSGLYNHVKDIKVYIYINSQAAIQRLQKIQDLGSGRGIVQKCTILAQSLRDKGVEITIRWIPGHSKILGNEIADELAKKELILILILHLIRKI
jgi:ribonuclease HI